jgi:hypothetical protein
MKKIPSFLLALIIGVISEGVMWALLAFGSKFGRDGVPLNGFTELIDIVHCPGFFIEHFVYAKLHPNYSPVDYRVINLQVVVCANVILWSMLAFVVISLVRRLYARKSKPAA